MKPTLIVLAGLAAWVGLDGASMAQASRPAQSAYDAAVQARIEGRLDDSVRLLQRVISAQADNVDALVQIGLAYLALDKREAAQAAFEQAIKLSPGYYDATIGLAQIRFRDGDIDAAVELANAVLRASPDYSDALLLTARIAEFRGDASLALDIYLRVLAVNPGNFDALVRAGDMLRILGHETDALAAYNSALVIDPSALDVVAKIAAPAPRRARLDSTITVSDLIAGSAVWTDSSISLTYQARADTALQLSTRLATRAGQQDIQTGLRIDHVLGSRAAVYAAVAVAPEANFLPLVTAELGILSAPIMLGASSGPLIAGLDIRHDVRLTSTITTIAPSLQFYLVPDKLSILVRWVHADDWTGNSTDGYAVRIDYAATDTLAVFAGYADVPEIDEGAITPARSLFAGLSLDLTEDVTLRANYARDLRETTDRQSVGLGLTVRF